MGGFVVAVLHHRYPDRVGPVSAGRRWAAAPVPPGTPVELVVGGLGPAAERLAMTFPDRECYRHLWRAHPALAPGWNAAMADYADYDLVGGTPLLRPSTDAAVMVEDATDFSTNPVVVTAFEEVAPTALMLRAPRGLLDEDDGMYPAPWVEHWRERVPGLDVRDVPDVNHYTLLLADRGAAAVAGAITELLAR